MKTYALGLAVVLLLGGCGAADDGSGTGDGSGGSGGGGGSGGSEAVRFEVDIAPILEDTCGRCHDTASSYSWAERSVGHALSSGHGGLSADDAALVQDWADADYPE